MRRLGFLALAMTVASCGGGGGGGGSPPAPPEPVGYTGATHEMTIDAGNAEDAAGGAYFALAFARNAGDFAASLGDVTVSMNENLPGPDGGSVNVRGRLNSGLGTITVTFDRYADATFYMDGQFTQRIDRVMGGSSELATLDFARFDLVDTATSLHVAFSGTIRRELKDSFPGAVRKLTVNLVVRDEDTDETHWLRDVVIDRRSESPPVGMRLQETYSGRIYDSFDGYATLSSEGGGFLFNDLASETPFGGGTLRVTAGGNSSGLRALNALYAAVLFDEDNDGAGELAKRASWEALGDDPPPPGNHIPQTATASVGQLAVAAPVMPNALFSTDADGDWLHFQWGLALAPVGSAATLTDADSATPRFVPDRTGEYLLTVRVSDGTHIAHDSARLTVVANPDDSGVGWPVTVVTRPPDASPVGVPLELDATGSFGTRSTTVGVYDTALQHHGWIDTPNQSTVQLDSTFDGHLSYTPTEPGLHTVFLQTCFRTWSQTCSGLQWFLAVGQPGAAYHPQGVIHAGYNVQYPVAGDFDGDGDEDAAFHAAAVDGGGLPVNATHVYVLFPRGAGRFDDLVLAMPVTGQMDAGDLNGDGVDDIAGLSRQNLYLALSNGTGGFAVQALPLGACSVGWTHNVDAVAIADADADGRADLIHFDSCAPALVTRLQSPAGTLGAPASHPMPEGGWPYLVIGDVTGDQRADAVRSRGSGNTSARGYFEVWKADAETGDFAYDQTVNMTYGGDAPQVAIGDVDGDGRKDVIATDSTRLLVVRQLATGLLASPVIRTMPNHSSFRIEVSDFDADGRDDAWVRGNGLYLASPAGFTTPPLLFWGSRASDLSPGADAIPLDVNRDGLTDIVSGSLEYYGQQISGPRVVLARPADQ